MMENFIAQFADWLPFGYSFGAGMVTTVSPCGIAMLPAYISLYLGTQEEGYWSQSPWKRGGRALLLSAMVTLGFVIFFGIIGAVLSLGGRFLLPAIPWLAIVIGIVLILLGIYLLAGGHLYSSLPQRLASRLGDPGGSSLKKFVVFGIAYAIAAMSCALPVCLVVVGSALSLEGFASGLFQFISFSLGMGLIIALITLGSALFKEAVNRWIRRLVPVVARFSGLLLIFAGGYILYFWFVVGDIFDLAL